MLENAGFYNWKSKFESYFTASPNNLWYMSAGFITLIALAGGLYWYRTTNQYQEQAATTILADCLAQSEQAAHGKAQWADVVAMAHAGYSKFNTTQVAPYILSVEIDGLLAQGKKQEALELLDLMVSKLGTGSALYGLFKLKQILLKLDMPDMQDSALNELQQLAQASGNNFADTAQYYLGLYYQNAGQQEKALEIWKPLIAINDTVSDAMARSPWAALAQSKINGLA